MAARHWSKNSTALYTGIMTEIKGFIFMVTSWLLRLLKNYIEKKFFYGMLLLLLMLIKSISTIINFLY